MNRSSSTASSAVRPANRLAGEKSPYLLQHSSNPVDWYPWGEDAFATARRLDRPIFLSIGYATCHWCHVMAHESFEDPTVASLMNEAFINIKVDREERPDIDQIYMSVCQMMTGGGGWPLTIIMTPDQRPFFAATYVPKSAVFGRIGMLELIPRVREAWRGERQAISGTADQIVAHMRAAVTAQIPGEVNSGVVDRCYLELEERFDAQWGGFGVAPKFPSPHILLFLTQYWKRTATTRALEMVERTLGAMRRGGIFDHLGFGFHRYSTDREWLVPHFEKMLYDQAMLALAYTEAYQATGDARYAQTTREILEYVQRDMSSPEGAFYSAEDADSEGEEGRFYLWSHEQLEAALGEDNAKLASAHWNVLPQDEVKAQGTGLSILHEGGAQPDDREASGPIEEIRRRLLRERGGRPRPLKDDKILADWNGLMAAALARAGVVLSERSLVAAAEASIDFVHHRMRSDDGSLYHRYRDGEASIPAFLDDYAFVAWACLELYDATLEARHLDRALALTERSIEEHWDDEGGAFFFTSTRNEELLVRPKEAYDGALPSGNSVSAMNLVRLSRLTGREELATLAHRLFAALSVELSRAPSGHSHLVAALQLAANDSIEVVIVGGSDSKATQGLVEAARREYLPNRSLLLIPYAADGAALRRLMPHFEHYTPVEGQATAFVCRNHACKAPVTTAAELIDALGGAPRT